MTSVVDAPGKRVRRGWTQAEVVELVLAHNRGEHTIAGRERGECTLKLMALGLVQKQAKPVLATATAASIDKQFAAYSALDEPQRTLAVRYAIRALQALLPKRAAK